MNEQRVYNSSYTETKDGIMSRQTRFIDPTINVSSYPTFAELPNHFSLNKPPVPFMLENTLYIPHDRPLGVGRYGQAWRYTARETRDASKLEVVLKCEIPIVDTKSRAQYFICGPELQNEAEIHQKLYGFGLFSGDSTNQHSSHFLLMLYIPGITVSQFRHELHQDKQALRIRAEEIIHLWILIAAAFQSLHEIGYIHADGHSQNIIIGPNKQVKLIDFGLAHPLNAKRNDCYHPVLEQRYCAHLPPENFLGDTAKSKSIFAHMSQDCYTVGYHLDSFLPQYLLRNSDVSTKIKLMIIKNRLMHTNPSERLTIHNAICLVVSLCFSEKLSARLCFHTFQNILSTMLSASLNAIKLSLSAVNTKATESDLKALTQVRNILDALRTIRLEEESTLESNPPQLRMQKMLEENVSENSEHKVILFSQQFLASFFQFSNSNVASSSVAPPPAPNQPLLTYIRALSTASKT